MKRRHPPIHPSAPTRSKRVHGVPAPPLFKSSYAIGGAATPWALVVLLLSTALIPLSLFANDARPTATNAWHLAPEDYLDSVSFVVSETLKAEGRAYDDVFWVSNQAELDGRFDNDVWLVANQAKLRGLFADHLRLVAQTVQLDGVVSNGFWAVGGSVTASTNSTVIGNSLILGENVTLLGHIEGNIHAQARRLTIGGTIVGNLNVRSDEIIVRPGTIVVGDFNYVTTNRTIVLDSKSNVSGTIRHIHPQPAAEWFPAESSWELELYLFGASLLVGIPLMLLFPAGIGRGVQTLRFSMIKCGLAGLLFMILTPILILLAIVSVLGIPLALTLGAFFGVFLYIGKFPVALAIGTALVARGGRVSVPAAVLCLVAGLFLFYSMSLLPFVGESLQTVATAFGAGALILAAASSRGRVGKQQDVESGEAETQPR